jgi:LuxR family maltose regulon positive regulatory protein
MSVSILSTKLYIPPPREHAVGRPSLIAKLLSGADRPGHFALVSGPAGSGKTTLLSEFVARLSRPVAWVSLDAGDNDPVRFWTYLIAACQSILDGVGEAAQNLFSSPQTLPEDTIPTILINDLAPQDRPIVLVLDDYHEIQNTAIHTSLLFLLDHLPHNLHLIVSTRSDPPWPLARFRARNQLTEIRARDLRFSNAEAAEFLNHTMGLNLSIEDVAALEGRTEGWAAGLQLAALALQAPLSQQSTVARGGRSDIPGFIKAFTGSHLYVAEYLVEEVLQRQPEEVRTFLLHTSILKWMNAGLCEAVTDCQDGQAILTALQRANIFVIPLDPEGLWFRYHHLFADLLRSRLYQTLPAEAIDGLHLRASRYFEQAGMADEAIQHALAAQDYAAAVHLIESHTVEMLVRGYSSTVEGWLNALPAGLGFQSPRIYMAFIWMYLLHGNYTQIPPYVERLQGIFSGGQADPSASAEWLTLQSFLVGAQEKLDESLALAQQALEIVPAEDSYVRSMAYNALASAYQLADDYDHAIEACHQAIHFGRATANFFSEMMGIVILVQIALQHGQYNFAFETASEGIDRIESLGIHSPVSAVVYGALGQVYYQRYQIEQARAHILRAIQLSGAGGYRDIEIYLRAIYARLLQMQGDQEASRREIQKANDLLQPTATAWARDEAVSQQVRLDLAQDRLAAAKKALEALGFSIPGESPVPAIEPGQIVPYSPGLLYNSVLRILLHQTKGGRSVAGLRQGVELAGRLVSGALQGNYLLTGLESLLLRAQLLAALGEEGDCLGDVARALELAEPEGFISIFVEGGPTVAEAVAALLRQNRLGQTRPEYARSILAAFSASQTSSAGPGEPTGPRSAEAGELTGLVEQLTPREMEVLELLAAGDSNQDIADKLVITVRTVKKHTSNIYGKLGASSRTQAVAYARELGLLPTN